MKITHTHLIALILGVIVGSLAVLVSTSLSAPTVGEQVAEYYKIENMVAVSPHDIKTGLQKNTQDSFVLVDLRSAGEYETEHITSAVNVPNYVDPEVSGQDNAERLVAAFAELRAENPDKDIIMYCYSAACMASRKVGQALSEQGIIAKHLNIGWYEWKYHWTIWSGEDGLDPQDFITAGADPGTPSLEDSVLSPCSTDNEFGC